VSFVLLLVVLAVIGGIAVVAAGRGGAMPGPDPDRATTGTLAGDEVDRTHVDGLRFTLALRGYRMDEVDEVLDRLVDELERRDERIRELEGQQGAGGPAASAQHQPDQQPPGEPEQPPAPAAERTAEPTADVRAPREG
jgi:DivIVA domain-containing protein